MHGHTNVKSVALPFYGMSFFVHEKLSAWTEQGNSADLTISFVEQTEWSEMFDNKIHLKKQFLLKCNIWLKYKIAQKYLSALK